MNDQHAEAYGEITVKCSKCGCTWPEILLADQQTPIECPKGCGVAMIITGAMVRYVALDALYDPLGPIPSPIEAMLDAEAKIGRMFKDLWNRWDGKKGD